jgi:hypothetical protein
MLGLADKLIKKGSSEQALQVLELLSHDPDTGIRNEARFRRSKLLQAQGSTTDAAILLRQIVDEKPDATAVRLQLAQLLDQMGDTEGAWRQVRAAQAAGLPPNVARLVDRYSEALRTARPMGASFEIAIAPDSNISRSTRSDTLSTVVGEFQIDAESQAKSGVGLALRGQAFRRIPLGNSDHDALVRLSGSADLYRQSRFNDVAADFTAGPELHLGRSRLNLELGATMRWYGQKPFMRSVHLSTALTRPIGRQTQLWLRATASILDDQINNLRDGKDYSGELTIEHALTATTGVSLSLSGEREALRDPGYSTTGWRAGLLGWRDLGRTTFTAEAEFGKLVADERLSLFPARRADQLRRITFGATFRQFSFEGFAPVTRLVIERNTSSIEFYDYKRVRTEFAIVRAF